MYSCYAPVAAVVELCSAVLGRRLSELLLRPDRQAVLCQDELFMMYTIIPRMLWHDRRQHRGYDRIARADASGRIDPAVMVTHIGGLDAAAENHAQPAQDPGRQS